MKGVFKRSVKEALYKNRIISEVLLAEQDLSHLPVAVRKYITLSGAVGKPRFYNFRAEFEGGIRSKSSDPYMKLKSVQYNFFETPTRLFYIVAKKMGVPAIGVHLYREAVAIMKIKLLGLFTVVDAKGMEMNQGETVTVFNDMCFMAPASLIDNRITWNEIDVCTVEAKFKNGDITIGATLYFNEKGELINFISNDRFETTDGKEYLNYPWLTPVDSYTDINGYHLPSKARLIYRKPQEDFCYGEFVLKSIEYNCSEYK
ncbi:MAG: DUF6544 family protein [Bacteroidales bacterium]